MRKGIKLGETDERYLLWVIAQSCAQTGCENCIRQTSSAEKMSLVKGLLMRCPVAVHSPDGRTGMGCVHGNA